MTGRDGPLGRGVSRRRQILHLALFGLAVTAVGLWLSYIWLNRHDPEAWQRDWYCFYSAGKAFAEAGPARVYWEQCIEHYFWLYPPYMLYPYALASRMAPLAFYAVAVAGVVAATVGSLVLLGRALPERAAFESVAMATLGSGVFFAAVATGQHSAILLLGLAGAARASSLDRPVRAGLWLGLLGIKPNWAVVAVAWLVVTRRWRTLGGMAAVGALMIASTLPLGLSVWGDYLQAAPHWVGVLLDPAVGDYSYPAHKLATIEAFTRSTVGSVNPMLGKISWVVLEVLALAAGLAVWLRRRDFRDQLAMAVLLMVGANVYVEFYDGLVLAVPAAVWATMRSGYPAAAWKTIAVAAGAVWAWYWIWALGSPGPEWPALTGGLLAVWTLAEGYRAVVNPDVG